MTRSLRDAELLLATTNDGKREEFAALLAPYGARVRNLQELGLAEPDETEFSFQGNALIKARTGATASGLPTLADDSGLVVAGLGGAPGIYTADWAEGAVGRDFNAAMRKTWCLLEAARASVPRQAWFVCVIALAWPDGEVRCFEGKLEGELVWPMRGAMGHGYDPIFKPVGFDMTMGEMSAERKNRVSHRALAFQQLIAACFT